MSLQPQQFAQIAADLQNYGGFSAKVAGPGAAGQGPTGRKILVGGYKGVYEDFPENPPLTGTAIGEWSSAPERHRVFEEPNVLLGGFIGEDPPRQALDATEMIDPKKRGGTYTGRLTTAERNQESYGLTDSSGQYDKSVDYPYYVSGESQDTRDPDLFDAAWASSRGGKEVDPAWQRIKRGE